MPVEMPPEELTRIRKMQNTGFRRNLLQAPQSAIDMERNLGDLIRLSEIRFGPHLMVARGIGLQVHEVLSDSGVFHSKKTLGDSDQHKEFEDTAHDLEIQLFRPFMRHLHMFRNPIVERVGESLYSDLFISVQECLSAFLRKDDVKYFFQTFLRSMKKLHAALRTIVKITEVNGNMELPDTIMLLDKNADDKNITRKTAIVLKYLAKIAPALAGMIPPETRKNGKEEVVRKPQERMEAVAAAVGEVQRNFQISSAFTYAKHAAIQVLEEKFGRVLMDLPSINDSAETTMEERMFIFLGDSITEGLRRYREQENKNPERLQRCEDFIQILAMLGEANVHIGRLLERKEEINRRTLGKIIGYTSLIDLFGRLKAHEFFSPEAIDELLTAVAEMEVSVETYLYGGTPEKLQMKLQNLSDAIAHFELALSELAHSGYLPATPQKIRPVDDITESPVFF